MTDSIVKLFDSSEIRFVNHPENKFAFGIVATDMGAVLDHTDPSMMVKGVDEDWKGTSIVCTPRRRTIRHCYLGAGSVSTFSQVP